MINRYHLPAAPRPRLMCWVSANRRRGSHRTTAAGRPGYRLRPIAEACSPDLVTVRPGDEADKAIRRMREHGVRRVPVVENGKPVGILSIGDLAMERDEDSALADISAKAHNT